MILVICAIALLTVVPQREPDPVVPDSRVQAPREASQNREPRPQQPPIGVAATPTSAGANGVAQPQRDRRRRNWSIEMLVDPGWSVAEIAGQQLKLFPPEEREAMIGLTPLPIALWIEFGCTNFHRSLMGKEVRRHLHLVDVVRAASGNANSASVTLMTYSPTFSVVLGNYKSDRARLTARLDVRLYSLKIDAGRVVKCELLFEDRATGEATYDRAPEKIRSELKQAVMDAVEVALAGSKEALQDEDLEGRISKIGAVMLRHPQLNASLQDGLDLPQVLVGRSSSVAASEPRR